MSKEDTLKKGYLNILSDLDLKSSTMQGTQENQMLI